MGTGVIPGVHPLRRYALLCLGVLALLVLTGGPALAKGSPSRATVGGEWPRGVLGRTEESGDPGLVKNSQHSALVQLGLGRQPHALMSQNPL